MNYYAHSATKPDGSPDRDPANWQLLATHLRNVGELVGKSSGENEEAPSGLSARGRDKKAQPSALLEYKREFHPNAIPSRRSGSRTDL